MERFAKDERKLSVLILLLVGLFLLNACGGTSGSNPRLEAVSNEDSVFMMKGPVKGVNPTEASEPTFEGDKVIYKEPETKIFEPGILNIDGRKHVSFDTIISLDGITKKVTLEGDFDPSTKNIAIVTGRDEKNQVVTAGSIRYLEDGKKFSSELYIKRIDEKGVVTFPEAHNMYDAQKVNDQGEALPETTPVVETTPVTEPTPTTINQDNDYDDTPDEVIKPAVPVAVKPATPSVVTKPNPSTKPIVPTVAPKQKVVEAAIVEAPIYHYPKAVSQEMLDNLKAYSNLSGKPEDIKQNPDFFKPKIILPPTEPTTTPEVPPKVTVPEAAQPPADAFSLSRHDDDGIDLKLFPYSLGSQFPGQAVGCYAASQCKEKCYLSEGTDIIADRTKKMQMGDGFESIDLGKHVVYGSGLLNKHIIEVGKEYAKKHPHEFFSITDLSKKGGGKVGHRSHQNGLEVDVELPMTKDNRHVDYPRMLEIAKLFDQYHLVDRFFTDIRHISVLCKMVKASNDPTDKATWEKMFPWPGHETHLHVRDKCTLHNASCLPMGYPEKTNGIKCN